MKKILFSFLGITSAFSLLSLYSASSDLSLNEKMIASTSAKSNDTSDTVIPISVNKISEPGQTVNEERTEAVFRVYYDRDIIEQTEYIEFDGTFKQSYHQRISFPPILNYGDKEFWFNVTFNIGSVNWDNGFHYQTGMNDDIMSVNSNVEDHWVYLGSGLPVLQTEIKYEYELRNYPDEDYIEFVVKVWANSYIYMGTEYAGTWYYDVTSNLILDSSYEVRTNFALEEFTTLTDTLILKYDLIPGHPLGFPFDIKYIPYLSIKDEKTGEIEYISVGSGYDVSLTIDNDLLNKVELKPESNYFVELYTVPDGYSAQDQRYETLLTYQITTKKQTDPMLKINDVKVDYYYFIVNYTYIPGGPLNLEEAYLDIQDEYLNRTSVKLSEGQYTQVVISKETVSGLSFFPGNKFYVGSHTINTSTGNDIINQPQLITLTESISPSLDINSIEKDIDSFALNYSYIKGKPSDTEKAYLSVENLTTEEKVIDFEISEGNEQKILINENTFPEITFSPDNLYKIDLYTKDSYSTDILVSETIDTLSLIGPEIILETNFDDIENPQKLFISSYFNKLNNADSYSIKVTINNKEVKVIQNQDILEIDLQEENVNLNNSNSIIISYNWVNDKYFNDKTAEFYNFYAVEGNAKDYIKTGENIAITTMNSFNDVVFWSIVGTGAAVVAIGVGIIGKQF